MLKWLKTILGEQYTPEIDAKVTEEISKGYTTKAEASTVQSELIAVKASLKERDSQLEALKKSGADAAALREQIAQLQAANAQKDEAHAAELKTLKIANAVDLALTTARAKNTVAVRALLADFIAKADIAENGMVRGLDDEVKKLVEGKNTAFLFDQAPEKKFKGAKAAERSGSASDPTEMTLEKLQAMPPVERHAFSVSHPDEYKQLYNGGNE